MFECLILLKTSVKNILLAKFKVSVKSKLIVKPA